MLKKILKIINWGVFGILISAGIIVILSTLNTPTSFKFLTVQSGSMEPKIKLGSLVAVKPTGEYKVDDIITFRPEDNKNITVTHRIVGVEYLEGNKTKYLTKGDANEDKDTEKLESSQIIGKVSLSIPYLGFAVNAIKTPAGSIVFVVIPATLFIANEIASIKNEVLNLKKRRAIA